MLSFHILTKNDLIMTSTDFSPNPTPIQIPSDFSETDLKKEGLEPLKTVVFDGSRGRSSESKAQSDSILLKTLQDPKVEVEEPKQIRSDSELIYLWLQSKSFRTIEAYRAEIKRFMKFTKGERFNSLSIPLLCSYGEMIRSLDLAPSSQALSLATVKSVLSFGFQVGYLTANLGVVLKLPKTHDNRLRKVLPESQVIELVLSIKNPRDRLMIRLLYSGGLRVSELCALKWKDVIPLEKKGFLFVWGKGSKQRKVPINEGTWQELMKWKELQSSRGTFGEDNPLFPSQRRRGHLSRVQVLRIIKAAARDASLTYKISPHWMRHSFATHAIKNGASLRTLQIDMGHGSIRTTQGYISPGDEEAASDFVAL